MNLFEGMYWLRHFGSVRRFHAERFIGEQTVLHHSASTALLLIQALGPFCSINLIKAALCHDLEEGVTGDIPAPAKWACGNTLQELEAKVREAYNIPFPDLTETEQQLLKAADFLDATMTCLEQRLMGNLMIDSVFIAYSKHEEQRQLITKELCPPFYELWGTIRCEYAVAQHGTPSPGMEQRRLKLT